MLIRAATPLDWEPVRHLLTDCFGREAEATLVETLRRDAEAVIDIVADDVGPIIGHAMFSKMSAPFPALGLAPLAVTADMRKRGVASMLVRHGLQAAEREGWRGVFVLGEPNFYGRFGFDSGMAASFDCAYAGPCFMFLSLGGPAPTHSGSVRYGAAFATLN